MPLPLYYFLSITAVNILMSWALYVPYRMAHLHFLVIANMAISGYTAAFMVLSLQLPFWLALLTGFLLACNHRVHRGPIHWGCSHVRRCDRRIYVHLHHPHRYREYGSRRWDDGALRTSQHRR